MADFIFPLRSASYSLVESSRPSIAFLSAYSSGSSSSSSNLSAYTISPASEMCGGKSRDTLGSGMNLEDTRSSCGRFRCVRSVFAAFSWSNPASHCAAFGNQQSAVVVAP